MTVEGPGEMSVLYEANAQILSGTVFKMWYGWYVPDPYVVSLRYAESLDGLNWTQYSGNPLIASGMLTPHLQKFSDDADYYLYYVDASGVYRRHSHDYGMTWTADGLILALGGGGSFDVSIHNPWVMKLASNDYRMLYEAQDGSMVFSMGLAHSADGLSWTKDGQVLPVGGPVGQPCCWKIGSTYYCWCYGWDVRGSGITVGKSSALASGWAKIPGWALQQKTPGRILDNPYIMEALGNVYLFYNDTLPDESGSKMMCAVLKNRTLAEIAGLRCY